MKIIVTGASGFIGKNFLLKLPKSWDVVAVYSKSQDFLSFLKKYKLSHVKAVCCDLTNEGDLKKLVARYGKDFKSCVYLAANGDPAVSDHDPIFDLKMNTVALVNFLMHVQAKQFIYFSSGAVYDGLSGAINPQSKINPKLPYAISKQACEQYVKHFQKKGKIGEYCILRFFGAYGPFEPPRKIYTKLVNAFAVERRKEFVVRGNGENLIDAMHVYDTIDGVLKVLSRGAGNLTIDFCSGNAFTINKLVKTAASLFIKDPVKIIHQGSVPEYIKFRASNAAMNRYFKFKPVIKLQDGLKDFARFIENSKES